MSVRLSAYISAAPTGRICVKFETEDFHANLLRKSKFSWNQAQKSDTINEELRMFSYRRRQYIAIQVLSSSEMVSVC
jgi:hypothetical protein